MQRVATLTNILVEKLQNNAPVYELLHTVKMLESELLHLRSITPVAQVPPMAAIHIHTHLQEPAQAYEADKTVEVLQVNEADVLAELEHIKLLAAERNNMSYQHKATAAFANMDDIPTMVGRQPQASIGEQPAEQTLTDITSEPIQTIDTNEQAPTYPPSKIDNEAIAMHKDLNDTLVQADAATINEVHALPKQELSEALMEAPIKDLRKAIGINERYLYVHELFRGDESMYERSIKTINTFEIYPEAEYWIRRELKLKLGWNDSYQTVKQFDQLIKRRFA